MSSWDAPTGNWDSRQEPDESGRPEDQGYEPGEPTDGYRTMRGGDGRLRAADLAAGVIGAVVKDPVQDRVVWKEYLETVVKERDEWKDLYRACRDEL